MTAIFQKILLLIIMVFAIITSTYSNSWLVKDKIVMGIPILESDPKCILNPSILENYFGLADSSKVSGHCWYDYGEEGIHDPFDRVMKDILIYLLDEFDIILDSTKTNSNGEYQFPGLSGTKKYRLQVSPGSAYNFTIKHGSGYDRNDSDVDNNGRSDLFSFEINDSLIIDAGLYFNCSMKTAGLLLDPLLVNCYNGDFILVSAHLEGIPILPKGYAIKYVLATGLFQKIQNISDLPNFEIHSNGIYNIYQMILNEDPDDYNYFNLSFVNYGTTTISDLATTYLKKQICVVIASRPLSFYLDNCIGFSGRVWLDKNENGKQDNVESGIENAMVYLCNSTNIILDSIKTNKLGTYRFDNINPSQKYRIFVKAIDNDHFTLQNASGSDLDDSDVDADGKSDILFISPGSKAVIDAGLVSNQKRFNSSDNFQSMLSGYYDGFNLQGIDERSMSLHSQVNKGLMIYPNPFQENIQILIPENEPFIEYSIMNSSNTKIKSGILNGLHNSINLKHIPSGLYLFQWKSGTNIGAAKLIKI